MPGLKKHIIRNQFLEVSAPGAQNGMELQKKLKEAYYEKVLPVLDRVFSEYFDGDEVIRIKNLEIDLGTIPDQNFEAELTARVEKEVRRILRKNYPAKGKLPQDARRLSVEESRSDAFLHFLRHGTVPWDIAAREELSPRDLFREQLRQAPEIVARMLATGSPDRAMFRRLLLQFPVREVLPVLKNLDRETAHVMRSFLQEVLLLKAEKDFPASGDLQELLSLGTKHLPLVLGAEKVIEQVAKYFAPVDFEILVQETSKAVPEREKEYRKTWKQVEDLVELAKSEDLEAPVLQLALREKLLLALAKEIRSSGLPGFVLAGGLRAFGGIVGQTSTQSINALEKALSESPVSEFSQLRSVWKQVADALREPAPTENKPEQPTSGNADEVSNDNQRKTPQADESDAEERKEGLEKLDYREEASGVDPESSAEEMAQPETGDEGQNGEEDRSGRKRSVDEPEAIHPEKRFEKEQPEQIKIDQQNDLPDNEKADIDPKGDIDPKKNQGPEQETSNEKGDENETSFSGNQSDQPDVEESWEDPEIEHSPRKQNQKYDQPIKLQRGPSPFPKTEEKEEPLELRLSKNAVRNAHQWADVPPWKQAPKIEYYIHNAGIVLLWPFLENFFQACGLLEDKQFIDEKAQEKAIHLLQSVATGFKGAEVESRLPLNKILCGLPPGTPIGIDYEATEAEMAEAEKLLGSVIHYWSALGTMSVDGFRGTWLLRKGGIAAKDLDFLVRVEGSPWDLMLDYLPWGRGTIFLPWLKRIIHVEW